MKRPIKTGSVRMAIVLISLSIIALAGPAGPVVPQKARPIPLRDVRLTGGPLKQAQDQNGRYLLSLSPDRMMAFLRKAAGLEPKAEGYGGWDGANRQLTGHIAGHYLSGVSLMFAATGDPRFKERADYLVAELKAVQDKHGDGYIGAQADRNGVPGKTLYAQLAAGDIRSSGFDLNGMWSPWYVQHKIFAGLRDAYRFTGSRAALEVEARFAAWAESVLAGLDDAQIQKMLGTEFGGMNEVLVDLYADTGDKRWLALADRFEHRAIVEPLARGEDILRGKHGNTLVPKLLGSLERYVYHGRPGRRRRGDVLLGPGGPPPQLRHGRSRPQRVLRRARPVRGHDRRPDGRDLQRLQHDQDVAGALRPRPADALRRFPRAGPLQPHPRIYGPRRRRDLLHGPGGPGRRPRIPGHGRGFHLLRRLGHGEPRLARLRRLLRVRGHALGEPLRAFDGDLGPGGRPPVDVDVLSRGGRGRADDRDEDAAPLHDRPPPALLGGRRVHRQGQRQDGEGIRARRDPMSASAGNGRPGTGWS